MPRGFVVEAETAIERGVEAMLDQAARLREPAQGLGLHTGHRPAFGISRAGRVEAECMLDVGQQQLLVLLLVMQAKRDECGL